MRLTEGNSKVQYKDRSVATRVSFCHLECQNKDGLTSGHVFENVYLHKKAKLP